MWCAPDFFLYRGVFLHISPLFCCLQKNRIWLFRLVLHLSGESYLLGLCHHVSLMTILTILFFCWLSCRYSKQQSSILLSLFSFYLSWSWSSFESWTWTSTSWWTVVLLFPASLLVISIFFLVHLNDFCIVFFFSCGTEKDVAVTYVLFTLISRLLVHVLAYLPPPSLKIELRKLNN